MRTNRVRIWGASILGSLFALAVGAQAAHAVQASGSLLLIPSKQQFLNENEEITVEVYLRNTSTTTPNTGAAPLLSVLPNPASLLASAGPISIDLSSTDCGGPPNSTDLAFVPGPDAGCVARAPGVSSCAAGGPGEVLLNIGSNIDALDGSPVFLATIKLKNTVAKPADLPRLHLRASTGTCAVRSCLTPIPAADCVDCSAEGCTFVSGNTTSKLMGCKHSCLSTINFYDSRPDVLKFQAIVRAPGYDPAAGPLTLSIGLPGAPPALTVSVPSVPQANARTWRIQNGSNYSLIQIQQQTGATCNDSFKVIVQAFGDLSALQLDGDPEVALKLTLNGTNYENSENWQSIVKGGVVTKLQNEFADKSPC